jgi:MFS family permease
VLSDRLDRHRFLLALCGAGLLVGAALAVVAAAIPSRLGVVFALATIAGLVVALENPVRRSFVGELVGPDLLSNAVGLNAAVLTVTKAVGPAVAGLLIAGPGLAWCFIVNAASFAPQIVLFLRIDRGSLYVGPRVARAPGQIREGLRYLRSAPELRTALVMTGLSSMAYGNLAILLPILTTESFELSSVVFTFLFASMSVGMMVGSLVVARARALDPGWLARRSASLALTLSALAVAPTIVWAFGAAVVAGVTYVQVSVGANAIVQMRADASMRGRSLGILSILTIGTAPIAAPILGIVAEVWGSRWAIAATGLLAGTASIIGYRVQVVREATA